MPEYCLVLLNYYYNAFEAQLICGTLYEYAMFTKMKLKFGFEIISKFCKIISTQE